MVDRTSDATLSSPKVLAAARERPPARLWVVHPPDLVGALALRLRRTTVGRRPPDPDMPALPHGTVSRAHADLVWESHLDAHTLSDAGSRNGTFHNGKALAAGDLRPVAHGDVIRFGDVVTVYERGAGAVTSDGVRVDFLAVPGDSLEAQRLRVRIGRAASDPAPVLVIGETGTGKEQVTRELHRLSDRHGVCLAINCAELSAGLVESQLFGHERGAFTGAHERREGLFRQAAGGTLVLDEIGELPLELQPKLLRVLQEREVRPVGGTRAVPVDVRVIAATHRDLAQDVEAGRFRRDLYARLALWEIRVPPLRERRADLLDWAKRIELRWRRSRGDSGAPLVWEPEAVEALVMHSWPENLRGLERLVHGLVTRDDPSAPVTVAALGLPRPVDEVSEQPDAAAEPAQRRVAPTTRDELAEVLAREGSVRGAARWYGRDRRQIYRWMESFDIGQDNSSEEGQRDHD